MATWISREEGSNLLSETEAENNIICVADYLVPLGWTAEAVAGVGGNMWEESHLNPGQWQLGHYEDTQYGYGLGQWTPATKLINWCTSRNLEWKGNGNNQLSYLDAQSDQWHSSTSIDPAGNVVAPYISFDDFKESTLSPETLSDYWLWFWEDPGYTNANNSRKTRQEHAKKYYDLLKDYVPVSPGQSTKLKWWWWCKKVI